MNNPKLLLYIEPSKTTSEEPVIDSLTRKMTGAFRKAKEGSCNYSSLEGPIRFTPNAGWRGFHSCECGVYSGSHDYQLSGGEITNSLCIHYLAFHRDEIPIEQLDRVNKLKSEEEPTEDELKSPHKKNKPLKQEFNLRGEYLK